jgi:IMP dehydrogenase
MTYLIQSPALQYSDVVILPQFSNIKTRKDVSTSVSNFMDFDSIDVPIMCANMDTICEADMCIAMWEAGALGAMHRFMTIEENIKQYLKVTEAECECLVSLGVNEESKERFEALYNAGARKFVIDIAHGHSILMRDMLFYMKHTHPSVFVLAGNVGSQIAVEDLEDWGADAIKVGLAGGAVCQTKNVTGIETPMFTTIKECAEVAMVPLVADGGIKSYADCAKALGAGADMVMAGWLFAGCDETPPVINYKKATEEYERSGMSKSAFAKVIEASNFRYRGMASEGAMAVIGKTERTPEGISIEVERKGPAGAIVSGLKGGLQSAFSYSNASTLKEFQARALFRVRG